MENQPFVVRNHWFSSTYLGLLLRLEKGDIILVTLHQANWLHDVKIPYIFFFFFGDILWHLMGYILWQRWPCLENTTIFSWIKSQASERNLHGYVGNFPVQCLRTLEAMHPVSSNTFHWRESFLESWRNGCVPEMDASFLVGFWWDSNHPHSQFCGWLVVGIPTPLKNMTSSNGMMTFRIYGNI